MEVDCLSKRRKKSRSRQGGNWWPKILEIFTLHESFGRERYSWWWQICLCIIVFAIVRCLFCEKRVFSEKCAFVKKCRFVKEQVWLFALLICTHQHYVAWVVTFCDFIYRKLLQVLLVVVHYQWIFHKEMLVFNYRRNNLSRSTCCIVPRKTLSIEPLAAHSV